MHRSICFITSIRKRKITVDTDILYFNKNVNQFIVIGAYREEYEPSMLQIHTFKRYKKLYELKTLTLDGDRQKDSKRDGEGSSEQVPENVIEQARGERTYFLPPFPIYYRRVYYKSDPSRNLKKLF